jgi:large repetitive protein
MERTRILGERRWPSTAVRAAVVITALAGTALVAAPAASAASSAYAVTEVPVGYDATGVAADPATDTVYAALNNGHAVAVIDGATNTLTAQVGLPISPAFVAVDQAADTVYASGNSIPAAVYVISGATNAVTATISLPSGALPDGAAVNPTTHMLYVADPGEGAVVVINGSTDTVAATIPLEDSVTDPEPEPMGLAVDEATDTIYVADANGDQVEVIDGATNTLTDRIALPAASVPTDVAVDPAAGLVYVVEKGTAQAANGAIAVIDTATDSVSTLVSGLNQPEGVALDASTGTLYVTSSGGSVDNLSATYVVDTATGTIEESIPRGGDSVALLASGGSVYVDGSNGIGGLNRDVSVITPSTANTMSPVIVGAQGNIGATSFTFTAGQAGQDQLVASATPAATFTETGTLPPGISLSSSGLLSGTPTTAGAYQVTVTAANGIAPAATQTFSIYIDEAPAITSADQTVFGTGVAGSFTMTASGYPQPTFSESGALPSGVTLSSAGLLSGTPAAGTAGVYPITVTATNSAGSATQAFTLTVDETPAFTSTDQVVFGTGVAGSFTVTATGSPAPTFTETGALPTGVSLSSAGVLSGTPTARSAGTYSITITASNAGGTAAQAFTLIVDVPGAPAAAGGVLGDVTGNGLDDILAVDGSGNLWLYPNTGSGNASMFTDGRTRVGSGWGGYTLAAVAPLNGATGAGILAIAPGGDLWYYPNTGGTGTGTFGGRSLVGTGWAGYTVVGVTDLYGTGQPSILAIDPAGNLWYYPGTGGTGTGTFGARTQVGSGWTGYTADIASGTSIIAVDPAGTMWLYPNTGGTGTSTFGTPVQVSTGWAGYQAIDTGTLTTASNGADILGIDPAGNLWYYPNTGTGSYGTPIQVGTGWTGYRIN